MECFMQPNHNWAFTVEREGKQIVYGYMYLEDCRQARKEMLSNGWECSLITERLRG